MPNLAISSAPTTLVSDSSQLDNSLHNPALCITPDLLPRFHNTTSLVRQDELDFISSVFVSLKLNSLISSWLSVYPHDAAEVLKQK